MDPTLAGLLADAVVTVHLAFIVLAAVGGLAALRWPRVALAHVPALAWAAWVVLSGALCPLTPLEQRLRVLAGEPVYDSSFVRHYLEPLIYPPGLTRRMQGVLGAALLAGNAGVYSVLVRRRVATTRTQTRSATR